MTKEELMKLISDDMTASGSIPIDLNEKEVSRIIDVEMKHAYMNWRDAVDLNYAVLFPEAFRTPDFRKSRTIQLPSCVYGVMEFREIKDGSRLFGINDPDLRMERVMGSDLWLSPFSSDVIATRTVSYSWFDLARSFTLTEIGHKFNLATHKLQVTGRDPVSPVLIRAFVAIAPEDLYDYYYFQRWCIAKCKIQLHRVLKTFTYTVVGGVQITDMYGEQGRTEIEEINTYMKENDPADWFLMVC